MKPNKSIDGLATRDAKNSASIDGLATRSAKTSAAKNTPKKSQPTAKKTQSSSKRVLTEKEKISKNLNQKPVEHNKTSESALLNETIVADSLEIEVGEDFQSKKPKPKSTKKPEEKTDSSTSKPKTQDEIVNDFLSPIEAFKLDDDDSTDSENIDTEKTSKKSKKTSKKQKKTHRIRRAILITIFTVLILLGGFFIWGILWGNDIIAKITGGQGNIFGLFTFMEEKYDPLKTDANGRTNILAFGTSGYNMDGDEGNGVHDGAQLTDSIMMISLNQETGDIAMLSLPRDLKASPTCTATGKINEVYWCNGGGGDVTIEQEAAAATALMNEVGSILGVEFQYYAHLNWGSLVQIVDTLGGITITLDEDILDYYWTGAVFEAGQEYTIDGEQALGLARARHGTIGGDFSRGSSQQKILIGIKNKVFEKNLSISDILSLASTLGDNLRTNFSLPELKTVAHLSAEFDFDNMRQLSLYDPANNVYYMTTGTINEISYVLPSAGIGNYGAIQAYVSKYLSNDPRTYEDASIAILNATDQTGLASFLRDSLESEEGFNISTIGNTEAGPYDAQYSIYVVGEKVSGTVEMLEKYLGVSARPGYELPEGETRDYDIIIVIGPSASKESE